MIKPPHPQEHRKTARVGHQSPQACPPFNLIMAISNWLNFLLFLRVSIPRYFKYSHISTLNIPQDRVSTISVVENSSPGHTHHHLLEIYCPFFNVANPGSTYPPALCGEPLLEVLQEFKIMSDHNSLRQCGISNGSCHLFNDTLLSYVPRYS